MSRIIHRYTRERWYLTPFEVFWRVWIQGMILLVDFTLKPDVIPGESRYSQTEYWVDIPPDEICAMGYSEAVGLHDSIFWTGARIYARIHNGKQFPIEEVYPDQKDTAYTLNDAMQSNAERNFKKAMARVQLTAAADWQKLGLMVLLGVGVIVATKYFGIW